MDCLPGSCHPTPPNWGYLEEAGAAVGRLHRLLAQMDYRFRFQIPHFHDTAHLWQQLRQYEPAPEVQAEWQFLIETVPNLLLPSGIPTQIIHADLNLIEANELLEWAQYAGNFYGTPREIVFQKLNQGQDVLLEIELAGARQVRQQYPDAIRIFLCPPSLEELERRIRERGQDSEASIERRLEQARKELDAQDEFDYVIVNDNLEQALQELEALLYPPSPSSKEQQP
jgi:hypothetical protein